MNLGTFNLMATIDFSATNEWHCLFLLIGSSRASSHSSSAKWTGRHSEQSHSVTMWSHRDTQSFHYLAKRRHQCHHFRYLPQFLSRKPWLDGAFWFRSQRHFFFMKIKILLTLLSFLWCRQRPRRSSWWRLADLQSRERGCRLLHVCGSESSWYSLGQNQVKCSRYPNHKSVCLHCTAAVTMNTNIHMSKIVVNFLSLCHLWPLWRKKLYVLGGFFWPCLYK